MIAVLEEYKVECDISVDLVEVKGFEYYTGVTFEIISSSISGLFGDWVADTTGSSAATGEASPPRAFAIDAEALMQSTKSTDGENQVHFIIVPKNQDLRGDAIRLAEWLRSSSFKVILDSQRKLRGDD